MVFQHFLRRVVRLGSLTVHLPDGRTLTAGNGEFPADSSEPPPSPVTIRLTDRHDCLRMIRQPSITFGEGYMDGRIVIEQGDLRDLMRILFVNLGTLKPSLFRRMQQRVRRVLHPLTRINPLPAAKRNVAHHYALVPRLYEIFLDPDRQYSCAYFPKGGETLEAAQAAKKRHLEAKLCLKAGQKVLDIGCGWGGLALELARDFGARVTGITLSDHQLETARARAKAAHLEDKVDFRLLDYRKVAERFDRIVSVGMFEHVGAKSYRTFFRKIRESLTDDGVALLHTIGRATPPGGTNPWIRKYIFPGGYCPALSEVMAAIEHEHLVVTDVEVLRLHYAETLKIWHQRFAAARDEVLNLFDERFYRMWEFYLLGSEMSFRYDDLVVFQIQMARDQRAVPLSRDYICEFEAAHPAA